MRGRPHVAALAAVAAIAGCGSTGPGGGVPAVAAESSYGSVLSQVGAGHVDVTSIIKDPSSNPHEYAGNVADTQAAADAKLVVVNGAGYDPFMDRLLAAAPNPRRAVLDVASLVGAHGSDANPHLWYDPRNAAAVARAAAATLAKLDPAHAPAYRTGANAFVASLAPLEAEIASLHRRFAAVPFAYTERVPGYLTERIGLRLETPPEFARADEQGTDPPPQSVATMRGLVTRHRIRLLIYNAQASSSAAASIRDLARSSHVPVVGVTETLPPGRTYQAWLLDELRAIGGALSE